MRELQIPVMSRAQHEILNRCPFMLLMPRNQRLAAARRAPSQPSTPQRRKVRKAAAGLAFMNSMLRVDTV
jgi:hypothetical protein